MDRRALSFLVVGVLLGAVAASIGYAFGVGGSGGGGGGAGALTVLRLAHALPETHPVHAGMVRMKERVAEVSGGTVEIQIIPNGLLGNETALLEQVQKGTVDITKTSTAPMEAFVPAMKVFGLPYLFRDRGHFWRVLDGDVGREMLATGAAKGLRGLCYFDAGSRNFYTTERPVLTPEDLVGMKIRVQRSDVAMEMVRRLGGSPTPIPWGELYTALQQGMVDGAENNPPSYVQNNHYEVAKHFVFNEHTRVPDIVIMNASTFERLPGEVRGWLVEAAADASVYQRELWEAASDAAIAEAEAAGVSVYRPELSAFVEKLRPMLEEEADPVVREMVSRIGEVE